MTRIETPRGTAVSHGVTAGPTTPDQAAEQATQEAGLAVLRQAFDFETEERAEMQRESDALQSLMLAQLKSEDSYMQKWIGLI